MRDSAPYEESKQELVSERKEMFIRDLPFVND